MGATAPQPLPPVTNADGRLGLCDVLPGGPTPQTSWAQLASAAGARVNRWEFRWDRIQPAAATWNFASDDAAVASSSAASIETLGILIGTPAWATAAGQKPGNGIPRGLDLAPSDQENLWASYVRGVVIHYRGQVRTWEIWNEPDLAFFWSGTADDYFLLLSVAYQVIKDVDPAATVLIAGMVVPDLAFFSRVLGDAQRAEQSNGQDSFDAAAWHAYGQARLVLTNLQRIRAALDTHGFSHAALWVTEDGFPASNPNGEARQAAYILQTILYALAGGASHVLVYRAIDDRGPQTWGLLSQDGRARMGYLAFQVAARYLARAQVATYEPGANVERFEVYEPGSRVTVAWSRATTARTTLFPSGSGSATIVDWQGASQTATPSAGAYNVALPGASYNAGVDPAGSVVGGPPVLLVEPNPVSGSPSLEQLVPALAGTRHNLVALNPTQATASIQVSSKATPSERASYVIGPGSVQSIDLDLLAGSDYAGSYAVSAPPGVVYAAVSSKTLTHGLTPAGIWYGAGGATGVAISNPSRSPAHVTLDQYSANGKETARRAIIVGAGSQAAIEPSVPSSGSAEVIQSRVPVVVLRPQTFSAHLASTWYLVRPGGSRVQAFNPGDSTSQVDVRFIGSSTVTGQQLVLRRHRSYALSTHGAQAIVLTATSPVSLSGVGQNGVPAPAAEPSNLTSIAAGGPATQVALFNPSTEAAHLTYSLVSRKGAVQRTLQLPPLGLSNIPVRKAGDAGRGVVVQSDVPVVAVPAR